MRDKPLELCYIITCNEKVADVNGLSEAEGPSENRSTFLRLASRPVESIDGGCDVGFGRVSSARLGRTAGGNRLPEFLQAVGTERKDWAKYSDKHDGLCLLRLGKQR